MTISLEDIKPDNGFPDDLEHMDKIELYGLSAGFPEMSDEDKLYLLVEACKYHKERKDYEFINPYLDPEQVSDLLAER
jgi:hypothetical protein